MNSLWKKILVCTMMAAVLFSVAGCGKKADNTAAEKKETEVQAEAQTQAETETPDQSEEEKVAESPVPDSVKIDYKTSDLFTEDEMNAAVEKIMEEFNSWDGCEMHEISYTDDQMCKDNLEYVNTLGVDEKFVDCIVFTSSFHSPKNGGDAWEADYEYEGWQWFLGRTEDSDWKLLTWGY